MTDSQLNPLPLTARQREVFDFIVDFRRASRLLLQRPRSDAGNRFRLA
jgi:hypothetical protein